MEGISVNAYRGFRGYWRRKKANYQRLNGPSKRKFRLQLARLGTPVSEGGERRRPRHQRRWRIRIGRSLRIGSPRNWLVRLRDAYVRMMLSFAKSAAFNGGAVEYGGFGRPPVKEYEEKMILEIYRSVVKAQGQTVPCDSPNRGPLHRLNSKSKDA